MSEQKPQGWFVPLRVRFRSATERAQWEREHPGALAVDDQTLQLQLPTLGPEPEVLRRTQQIKELIRLGNVLRAQLSFELGGLNEVLQQIVTSISACTGFRTLVIFLVNNLNEEFDDNGLLRTHSNQRDHPLISPTSAEGRDHQTQTTYVV